ncbi:MAG: hypothetical protein ACFFB0_05080 [Promethearchaeota archaeon]
MDCINDKVKIFRDANKEGRDPYIELLTALYPSTKERLQEKAITCTTAFCRLSTEGVFAGRSGGEPSAGELAYIWHIYLIKAAFDLE